MVGRGLRHAWLGEQEEENPDNSVAASFAVNASICVPAVA